MTGRSSGASIFTGNAAPFPVRLAVMLAVTLVVAGFGAAACSDTSDTLSTDGAVSATAGAATTTDSLSPGQLGELAGATWAEAIQRVVALLRPRPEVAAVRAQVAELKEEYVQRMVTLGRQIARLQLDGRAVANGKIEEVLEAAADVGWFKEYVAIYEDYSDRDLDFAYLLASFNILTQYADFELLKTQDPEEAARLGIE